MAASLFSLIVVLTVCHITPPVEMHNAEVSGILPFDVVWSGVIFVDGDIFVPSLFTLTIKSGTKVFFRVQDVEGLGSGISNEIAINASDPTATDEYEKTHSSLTAKIIANGTLFTSAAKDPSYADWSSLNLLDGSKIEGSTVEYTRNGVILIGNVTIINTTSHHALWNCFEDQGVAVIVNSTAHHCWHSCIFLNGNNITTIRENELYECNIGIRFNNVSAFVSKNAMAQTCKPFYGPRGDVQLSSNNVNIAGPDSFGGTYRDRLIYPSCD